MQGQELEPGDQVGGDRGDLDPHLIDGELPRREPADAGVLRDADAVLDPGVGPVPGLQEPKLTAAGVGGEGLVAPAVGLLDQGQSGAGMRLLPPDDDPKFRPATSAGPAVR